MKLSVIMPTYNRAQLLPRSVGAIFDQTLNPDQYEVLVVDDGSTNETVTQLQRLASRCSFRHLSQAHQGAAVARNLGIREARFPILVFIQDDIIVSADFLKEHLRFHEEFPDSNFALVGYTTWHPELKVTPFMHWLEHGGPQFDYDRLIPNGPADHLAFYTSNLSLKRALVWPHELMDPDFHLEGTPTYDDTEWGWRLYQKGMRLYYRPAAKAYHDDPKNLQQICLRQERLGYISHRLFRKHPQLRMAGKNEGAWQQLRRLKTGFLSDRRRYQLTDWVLRPWLISRLEALATRWQERVSCPLLYKIVCGYHYNIGYRRGLRKKEHA